MRMPIALLLIGASIAGSLNTSMRACERALNLNHLRLSGPRFVAWQDVPADLSATDWKTPLWLATLPLAVAGACRGLARLRRRGARRHR